MLDVDKAVPRKRMGGFFYIYFIVRRRLWMRFVSFYSGCVASFYSVCVWRPRSFYFSSQYYIIIIIHRISRSTTNNNKKQETRNKKHETRNKNQESKSKTLQHPTLNILARCLPA